MLQCRLTADEAVHAATAGGAAALRRTDVGIVRPGARADLHVLDAPSHEYLAYRSGVAAHPRRLRGGRADRLTVGTTRAGGWPVRASARLKLSTRVSLVPKPECSSAREEVDPRGGGTARRRDAWGGGNRGAAGIGPGGAVVGSRYRGGTREVAPDVGTLRHTAGSNPQLAGIPATGPQAAGTPATKGRVLVVDDDDTVREVLRRYLTRDGHEVIEAADGPTGAAPGPHGASRSAWCSI